KGTCRLGDYDPQRPGWRNWSDAVGLNPTVRTGVWVRLPPRASMPHAEARIRLQPRARRDEVVGERAGAIVIRVTAPPVDGPANGGRRLGAADLGDLGTAALERHQELTLRRLALGLDDQLHRALEPGRRLEQPRGEAEDRAHVDVLAGARRAPRPVIAPAGQR